MPVDFGLAPIEAKEGDAWPNIEVYAKLTDVNGDPVTAGTPILRVGTFMSGRYQDAGTHLLDATLIHTADGIGRWEPTAGQLVVGRWRMEVKPDDATVPTDGYGTLVVWPALPEEPL